VDIVCEICKIQELCFKLPVLYKGVWISYAKVVCSVLFLCKELIYLVAAINDRQHLRRASNKD